MLLCEFLNHPSCAHVISSNLNYVIYLFRLAKFNTYDYIGVISLCCCGEAEKEKLFDKPYSGYTPSNLPDLMWVEVC